MSPSQHTSGSLILTVSEDDQDSLQVIFTVGINEIKFFGHMIPVTIIVHPLPAWIVPILPLNGVEETNHVNPTKVTIALTHGVFPVLI